MLHGVALVVVVAYDMYSEAVMHGLMPPRLNDML